MTRPGIRFRLTVRRLMAIVMMMAASLAAFRIHPSLGSFTAGVFFLATIRSFRKVDRFQAHDMPLHLRAAIRLFGESAAIAAVIIGVSSLLSLLIYVLVDAARNRPTPPFEPELN